MPWRLPAIGRSAGVLALATFLGLACASPTLPLPPPELPSQGVGVDADHIVLSADCGAVEANAIVLIVNENPTLRGDQAVSGSIASPCGKWDAVVYAHMGDRLDISQQAYGLSSPETVYLVR